MKSGKCPKCSSTDIMAELPLLDRHYGTGVQHLAALASEKYPDMGLILPPTFPVRAWICGSCGFTELYTSNLSDLSTHYKKAQEWQRNRDQR